MDKILIFTSFFKLNLGKENDDRKFKNNISYIKENRIISYDPLNKFQSSQSINEGEIFLVQDTIEKTELDQFLNNYNKNQIGVLYHIHGGEFKKDQILEGFNANQCIEGQHEVTGKYYPTMLSIISDSENNKFGRLVNELFKLKLNAALEFLHECLNSKPSMDLLKSFKPEELNIKSSSGTAENKSVNVLFDDYIKTGNKIDKLASLRDSVLEMAGVN